MKIKTEGNLILKAEGEIKIETENNLVFKLDDIKTIEQFNDDNYFKEEKEQLKQLVQLSSETIERNMLSLVGKNQDNVSLSCVQLDNAFVIMNFKNTKTIKWVSEEEKNKAYENELVWGLYYGQENMHASSVSAIMNELIKI